jgi:hypothetical protein
VLRLLVRFLRRSYQLGVGLGRRGLGDGFGCGLVLFVRAAVKAESLVFPHFDGMERGRECWRVGGGLERRLRDALREIIWAAARARLGVGRKLQT